MKSGKPAKQFDIRFSQIPALLLPLLLILVMCKKFEPERRLIVQTDSIFELQSASFKVEGSIIFMGNGDVEQYGFCYSENRDPNLENSIKSELGSKNSTGTFQSTFNDLSGNTSYYVRAYASDKDEIAYGKVVSFKTMIRLPVIQTSAISSITEISASSGGTIIEDGGDDIIAKGVCWSTSKEPVVSGDHTSNGTGSSNFDSFMEGLNCNTKYYVRAYASNSLGTGYGDTISFLTLACSAGLPVVTTSDAGTTTETSAICGGNVIEDGGSAVTERGVCWSISQNPTLTGDYVPGGNGMGSFSVIITGLNCMQTYYARAYATNASGTSYGAQVMFITSECSAALPNLTTTPVTNIGETTAESGGNITDDGGASVIMRGVCWSITQDPTLSDPHSEDGGGIGPYTSLITGLSGGVQYYVRAYATNASGTAYGEQVPFTSSSPTPPTVTTATVSNITENTAQSGGNVTDEGSQAVTARGVCWSTSPSPTISNETSSDGMGPGIFTSNLTGLNCGTTYYVRAYAKSLVGTEYGAQEVFTTDDCPATIPEVTTSAVIDITPTTARSGGEVISEGGSAITARGVCWSTSPGPKITDSKTTNGEGVGVFISDITSLETNTQYYVRAYATNLIGTGYGNEVSFNTNTDLVTDYDGNIYQTILIGEQTWMKENLKVKHFSDGTPIPLVENTSMWDALIYSDKAYCWNDNNASTGDTYGALYTWAAALNGAIGNDINPSTVQGVCPTGWHLPSDSEWKQMEMQLGMTQIEADNTGWRGSSEGGKLKEVGITHWNNPNSGADNTSGFTALPGGNRYDYGTFFNVGSSAFFWTITDKNLSEAKARSLSYNIGKIYRSDYNKTNGFSVRCVKDQ
ncbi:MAG: FISUMP domain-containing protein [Bacteroidales bacterium]